MKRALAKARVITAARASRKFRYAQHVQREKHTAKEMLCGFGVDVDAVAGWLGSYGREDSRDDISRGLFAGEMARRACQNYLNASES